MSEHARSFLSRFETKTKVVVATSLVALALYLLGVKIVFFPALVTLAFLYLPLPSIFRSVFARAFASIFFTFCLLPIAGALQYLFFQHLPEADFRHTAFLATLLSAAILLFAPARTKEQRVWFSAADAFGLLVGVFFILPFMSVLTGDDTFAKILQFAGFQVVDAGHHFSFINHYGQLQFLNMGYYPAGFHFSTAFVQESAVGSLFDAGWRVNAGLYFAHYIVIGMALAYAAYYLCIRLFETAKAKLPDPKPWKHQLLLALCLGPALAAFYLLPLFAHGFLNYMFLIATLLLAFIFLIEVRGGEDAAKRRWFVFAYFILAYGAISTWTLLTPLVAVIGVLFLLPPKISWPSIRGELTALRNLPILLVLALQATLMYFQATTIQLDSAEGLNATGNLHELHYLVLLAGFALVTALALHKKVDEGYKKILFCIFMPAFAAVIGLSLMQYFQVGEIRYFSVKTALFVEILCLILGVALLVRAYVDNRETFDPRAVIMIPLIPIIAMTLLMSPLGSPLREIREIFRPSSGIDKPQYYEHDARIFVDLGTQDKMKNFNTISLHYIKEYSRIDGYMQLSYRANLFRQGNGSNAISSVYGKKDPQGTPGVIELRGCNDKVYALIEYGNASPAEQQAVVETLLKCADMAKGRGLDYYVITDKESAPEIERIFGDAVKVVY